MSEIRMGDRVVFKDPNTNMTVAGKVTDVVVKSDLGTVYVVVTDNGTTCSCSKAQLTKVKLR